MARYRYKRGYRRGYKKSTRTIMMKFQSFMDISTNDSSMQIITISAGGPEVLRRLSAQFAAYKYYKLGNVAVKLVPASTLPVDPTGLSIATGDNLVDPRDQLTPGMMRITNGEDIFEDITGLTDEEQHGIYNNMLLDPRWFKWMLQSGVKRHATPRYYQIGQFHQDKWPGSNINFPMVTNGSVVGTAHKFESIANDGSDNMSEVVAMYPGSVPEGIFQTGHTGRLGWMPTDGLQAVAGASDGKIPLITSPPEIEVMKIILPKAYKTRYWYRAFITETVFFREPIMNFGLGVNGNVYRPLDVFHSPSAPYPELPNQNVVFDFPVDSMTGGNYGDD